MPILVYLRQRIVAHIGVEIQGLRISENGVGHRLRNRAPVGRIEARHGVAVPARPEVVGTSVGIAFFPGELVILRATICINVLLSSPRKIVGIVALGSPPSVIRRAVPRWSP